MLEFKNPIPVYTSEGDGIALYVKANGALENDEWCVVMKNGGQPKHFLSNQIRVLKNATYGITPGGMPLLLDQVEAPGLPGQAEDQTLDSLHR